MQDKAEIKLIYTDNGQDKALTGQIISEDDFFINFKSRGNTYRIGKKAIVAIKEVGASYD